MSTFGPTVAKSKNTAFDLAGIARSLQWRDDRDRTRRTDCSRSGNARSLRELTREEWESLCDGCGRCCLKKLQDEATGKVAYTDVACKLLDRERCRCRRYARRHDARARLRRARRADERAFDWLPTTCAYRKLAAGEAARLVAPARVRRPGDGPHAPASRCAAARWPSATSPATSSRRASFAGSRRRRCGAAREPRV